MYVLKTSFPVLLYICQEEKCHCNLIAHPGAVITDRDPIKASSTYHLLNMSSFSQPGYIFFLSLH